MAESSVPGAVGERPARFVRLGNLGAVCRGSCDDNSDDHYHAARLEDRSEVGGAVGEREELRRLNVLFLAMAIDDHTLRYGPTEAIHDEGTCTTDCAGDIAARYSRLSVNEGGPPVARTEAEPHE